MLFMSTETTIEQPPMPGLGLLKRTVAKDSITIRLLTHHYVHSYRLGIVNVRGLTLSWSWRISDCIAIVTSILLVQSVEAEAVADPGEGR